METINSIKEDKLTLIYQGVKHTIDLTKELSIDENLLNSQLKELPSNYAFLCLQRDKAIKERDKRGKEKDLIFSELWVYIKDNEPRLNNDTVAHKIAISSKFKEAEKRYMVAVDKAARLISICKAYETRERIIQTLAANLRKEKI